MVKRISGNTQGWERGLLEGKIMVNNFKNLILNRNESASSSDVGESVKRTDRLSLRTKKYRGKSHSSVIKNYAF